MRLEIVAQKKQELIKNWVCILLDIALVIYQRAEYLFKCCKIVQALISYNYDTISIKFYSQRNRCSFGAGN